MLRWMKVPMLIPNHVSRQTNFNYFISTASAAAAILCVPRRFFSDSKEGSGGSGSGSSSGGADSKAGSGSGGADSKAGSGSGGDERIHSTDIAFKPAESGWGAGTKYSTNFDNIFGTPSQKEKPTDEASTNKETTSKE